MVITVIDLDPSRQPSVRSSKAPAWPVSLRERYGSITLAEVLRFYLVSWDTRRNLRRYRRRQGKRASWTSAVRRNLFGVIAFGWGTPATATTPTPTHRGRLPRGRYSSPARTPLSIYGELVGYYPKTPSRPSRRLARLIIDLRRAGLPWPPPSKKEQRAQRRRKEES